jgi:acetyl esterase/lipase
VWISVGSHEIFFDDIVRFADLLRKAGVDPDLDVTDGGIHVWQIISDNLDEKKYLNAPGPSYPEGKMRGAANIANAILAAA